MIFFKEMILKSKTCFNIKEKVKTPKPSKSSDSAWLEELFGSTPPQIKKAEPKLKKPEAIGRASLSPSPWDDDDDFQVKT